MREGIAGPPHFAQVPADVNWLVHADIDALRNSTVFQHVFKTAATRWKSLPANLDKVNQQFGLDLAKDLHGMTVFGPPSSQQNAVLVMRADWAAETFRQKLCTRPAPRGGGGRPLRDSSFRRKRPRPGQPVAAALWKPGTFVFGQAADDAKFSLEVLDGKRPGLSGASPLAAKCRTGRSWSRG